MTRSGYLALVVSPPVHQSPSVQPLNYSILLRVVVSFTFVMVSCGLFKTRQDMNHVYSINVNSHPLRIGGELEWVGLRIIVRKEHLKLRNRVFELVWRLAVLVIVALVKGLMPGDACCV